MDPKWDTKKPEYTTTYILPYILMNSPTTPRRSAGMLDLEPCSPRPQTCTAPQTPSLLSRLFSWGTPNDVHLHTLIH